MSRGNRARAGFTLVEVLASAVLIGIGVVGSMVSISKMEQGESLGRRREALTDLTIEKYNELVATTDFSQANSLNGDFTDRNDKDHTWTATVQAVATASNNTVVNTANSSASTSIDSLSVTVQSTVDPTQKMTVTGLIYVPPATTAPAAGG